MKTKEEIIKELVESIVKEYDLIPNPHGAFIYESDCHNHRVSLKYLIRDCINRAYLAGFEDFRGKVEEGVKKQFVNSVELLLPATDYRVEKMIVLRNRVLETIKEIKQ